MDLVWFFEQLILTHINNTATNLVILTWFAPHVSKLTLTSSTSTFLARTNGPQVMASSTAPGVDPDAPLGPLSSFPSSSFLANLIPKDVKVLEDQFRCRICFDLVVDPVMTSK